MDKAKVRTLQDLITEAAAEYGTLPLVREKKGKEIVDTSFVDLLVNAKKVNAYVSAQARGERLHAAVIGATSSAYLTAYFGTVCGGNVIVPLDAQLSGEDLCDHLERADVKILFLDKKLTKELPLIKETCKKIEKFVTLQSCDEEGVDTLEAILTNCEPFEWMPLDPKSLACILYTSGTTGKSKGVMLSHANLIDNTMCQDDESVTGDSVLSVLPIHHVYCFTCDILLSIRYGVTICVNDSMLHIAQNLKLFEPTYVLLVPLIAETIYQKIRAASASMPGVPLAAIAKGVFGTKLKGIYSGGAYLRPELLQAYLEMGIPMAQGYGMTECSPRISTGNFAIENKGDVGPIVNGCEVKIVDGEIWAKSPSVMMGYYKNPEATAETLTEDGWLKTGDLGYVDERNCVFITGRKKNLIILSNGENVSPEELENKFADPDFITEVMVYAEDSLLTVEIFPNQEYLAHEGIDREALITLCKDCVTSVNKTVTSAKQIRRIRLREEEFFKTPSKKIKREQPIQGELIG